MTILRFESYFFERAFLALCTSDSSALGLRFIILPLQLAIFVQFYVKLVLFLLIGQLIDFQKQLDQSFFVVQQYPGWLFSGGLCFKSLLSQKNSEVKKVTRFLRCLDFKKSTLFLMVVRYLQVFIDESC